MLCCLYILMHCCVKHWYLGRLGSDLVFMNTLPQPVSLFFIFFLRHDISLSYRQGSRGFNGFPGANGEKGARVRYSLSLDMHDRMTA